MNTHSCNRARSFGTGRFSLPGGLLARRIIKVSLAAWLLFIPRESDADWSPGGVQATALGGGDVKIASDGAGGVFIAWTDGRASQGGHGGSSVRRIYLQHLTSSGAVAPGWLANGNLISSATASNYFVSDLVPDGFGGALVSWIGSDAGVLGIFATRVLPDGGIAPGWPQAGYKACCTNPTYAYDARLATDGSGGAYLAWNQQEPEPSFGRDVFVQHITSLGTLAPGWQSDGIPIVQRPGYQSDQHVIPAPGGGLFLAWVSPEGGRLQRVTAGGAIESGWPALGLQALSGNVFNLNLQPDGHDGAMISAVSYTPTQNVIVDRRASPDAQLDPSVILGSCSGPQFCSRRMLVSTSDPADGFLHAWLVERFEPQDYGEKVHIGRTLLGPPASIAPGWPADGVRVSTVPGNQSYGKFPGIAPDGDGGAFVAFDSYGGAITGVWVQHVRADGSIDPGWGPEGKPILPTPVNRWEPAIIAVGPGQAIVVWHEGSRGLYAQKLTSDGGPVPTLLSLVDYDVQSGRVTLRWQASDAASLQATIERSVDGEEWIVLGAPRLEGKDLLVYDDESVPPGRYSYRLRYIQDSTPRFSDPVWVDVTAVTSLALEGFQPNPALESAAISFSLPDAQPASLQVHDVRGRQVFSREVGVLGPGAHVLRLDESEKLGVGVYWVRLVRSDGVLTTKGIIVR